MDSVFWYPGHELLAPDIVRAENCHLHDSRGRRYVDLEAGVWCLPLGHGHPRVLRVLAEQAASICHTGFGYAHRAVEEAARAILALPGLTGGACVFLCSGSEAVEYAVRVARMISARPLFLTMSDSYFGAYGSASTKRPDEWFLFDWAPCADCPDDTLCGDGCDRWRQIPLARIGALLFEPGSSSGLVRFPPVKLVRGLAAAIAAGGGLVLVNEVTTGMGRTGEWFGYQHYGLTPDLVAMGKGVGNGYPVSVVGAAAGVRERLAGRPVPYAQSHQNDPLGARVAHEVVRVIAEEGLIERGREIAALLSAGLEEVRARGGGIAQVRSRGLMAAIELAGGADPAPAIRVHRGLARRGYLVGRRPGVNVLRLDPSLTIEREDVVDFLEALEDALRDAGGPAG